MSAPPDFQVLGADIRVLPDLDEDENLAEGAECVAQDLLNGWSQPTGLADGTKDGAQWGVDLQSYLNTGLTPDMVFALKVALEVQAQRDDRLEECVVDIVLGPQGQVLIAANVVLHGAPYLFSYTLAEGTLSLAQTQVL